MESVEEIIVFLHLELISTENGKTPANNTTLRSTILNKWSERQTRKDSWECTSIFTVTLAKRTCFSTAAVQLTVKKQEPKLFHIWWVKYTTLSTIKMPASVFKKTNKGQLVLLCSSNSKYLRYSPWKLPFVGLLEVLILPKTSMRSWVVSYAKGSAHTFMNLMKIIHKGWSIWLH